jgi:basic amino acid/polyamine antiporter, APA family
LVIGAVADQDSSATAAAKLVTINYLSSIINQYNNFNYICQSSKIIFMSKQEETPSHEFKRSLGLLDATMIVAGSMIGSGIFIVSADMGRTVGSAGWLLFLWLITGVITIFAALSYGELAGMMPKAGGQFVYIKRAWGEMPAFLYGWSVFAVTQTGLIAAVAVAFAKYTGIFFPAVGVDNILFQLGTFKISGAQLFAIFSIFVLTFINSRGVQNGKMIQLVFTSAKIFAIFALIILGLYKGIGSGYFTQNMSNLWDATTATKDAAGVWHNESIGGMALVLALGSAIVGSLFSSDAWNSVTFIAGEIKDPRRNIPRSLLLGTVLVTFVYIMVNLAYLCLLPLKGTADMAGGVVGQGIQFAANDRVGTAAASMIFGDTAVKIMALLIMVSTFGCNSGLILSGARVYYAMAQDKLFFKQAGTLNDAKVPSFALWAQCVWASLLCLSGKYGDLLDYLIFVALIFYALTIAGVIVLRKKEPDAERPYKVPLYPILPIAYIIMALTISAIVFYTKTEFASYGLIIVLLGLPLYYIQKSNK